MLDFHTPRKSDRSVYSYDTSVPGISDFAPDGDRFTFRTSGTAAQTSDDDPFNGLIFVDWFEEPKQRVPVP